MTSSQKIDSSKKHPSVRQEKDLLGILEVPSEAYYGIQTLRAVNNFHLSGVALSHYPRLVVALAMVKQAAAEANHHLGHLDEQRFRAIHEACQHIIEGRYHEQFVVDMIQGGAGTSTNMNANEVIANVGLEILGHARGDYHHLHPNNDVNMSQSTNDAYPTAIRLGLLLGHDALLDSLEQLSTSFAEKGRSFADVLKMGRTQLQDAVPMTLGQEFQAFATTLGEDLGHLRQQVPPLLREVNLGGTAIGTGINADPGYQHVAVNQLARISGQPLVPATDLIEATSDMGAFVLFSSMLKRLAVKLSKICNDLRLLSSGPRTGLNEINLPARQPGSSIMPGKVNPVIPEAVNQVAFEVIGNDLALTMAAEGGQLQLNVMEPLIAYKIFDSIRLLTRAMDMLREQCIVGITANREHCQALVEGSIGLVTALNPYIGYENSTRIARQALTSGRGVLELVREEGLLDEETLQDILRPENMIAPRLAPKNVVNKP
ncbi:aspartate ammonia-lyase [Kushneria marisflavi]|uniref:Aspartate ammonia-lyase n=1 Tax=Kushneria marisflavi TaxID=157779 RepID=A0A240USR3_9GAMM|nr:aspartate ammonia-lyase [Kushneria marisflavi]ART64524.1 aspartate ammonia-lyase [Kushneria marisflavi]RKD86925.1 aspartate ammonia-lyase [Kushneria marisflavi]